MFRNDNLKRHRFCFQVRGCPPAQVLCPSLAMTSTKLESAKLASHYVSENKDSIKQMHEIFPEWSFEDLAIVLSELGGDMETAVQRISEGMKLK